MPRVSLKRAAAIALPMLLAACAHSSSVVTSGKIPVATTISTLNSFVQGAGGEYVSVKNIVPIGASPVSPEQSVGQVSLTSDPTGGEIQIDGKFFGNTPAVLALAPGEHKVQVTSAGKTWERTLSVSVGSKLVVNAVLEQAAAQ